MAAVEPATAPIWPGLLGEDEQGPFLVGGRCRACGFLALGVRDVCGRCWAAESMEAVPVGRTGRLYTCTVVHQPPDGFAGPIAVGYVDLPEGLRVFAHIAQDARSLTLGTELALTVAPLRRGRDGGSLTGPLYVHRAKGRTEGEAG